MSVIKLGLSTMPIPDKIQFARRVAEAISGNPAFPVPTPSLASLGGQDLLAGTRV